MSNLRQAAEQALVAMENLYLTLSPVSVLAISLNHRITDLRAALAEPEQEPVAWMDREGDLYKMPEIKNWAPPHTMLYTTPPQRKPLTDKEIHDCFQQRSRDKTKERKLITRAIEQAHGIKGEA